MTGFDIAVLLLVGLGAVTGFMRGFVQEVLALLAWIGSLFAIHQMHTPLSAALIGVTGTESGASVLAFALLLLVPFAVIKLIANRMGEASRNSVLGPIDRLLGFGFGALKGMVIVVLAFSVFMLGLDIAWGPTGRPQWVTQARAYPFVNASSEALVKMLAERRKTATDAEAKAGKPKS